MDGLTLIRRAKEAGLAVQADGEKLVIRGPKRAEPVARLLIKNKPAVLAALQRVIGGPGGQDAAWWRRHLMIRSIHWELRGYRSRRDAERLAFGDMLFKWHRRHGIRPEPGRCAGCGDELPDEVGLVIDRDGSRVHFDGVRRVDCIIAFGCQWRAAAAVGLHTLGLDPPEGFEL